MKKGSAIALIVVLAIALVVAYKLLWTTVQPKIEHRVSQLGLTENERAANGPLPGDVSLYEQELECCQGLKTPGYYPGLNAAELADGQRSGVFACATFTGSFDGPNRVLAWRSEDSYQGAAYICNRKPGEIFVAGGANPPLTGPLPPGPFVAKADATTGREIWRTYLDNGNASGRWIAAVNLNILANGKIAFAWENNIALLDADTGLILKRTALPTGDTSPANSNFKHVTVGPDGTIFAKNQTRPIGYEKQGTLAIVRGVQEGFKQPNSHLVALNPDTLEILDHVSLPEPATVPHIACQFEGKTAIYLGVDSGALRYFWDPRSKKLSLDSTWNVKPMQPGQTTADAPSIMGDWIILQTNGIGSKTKASSVVAVHQKDSSRMTTLFPFGELKPGEMSFAPPKPQTDPENNMIYSADFGVNKVAGITFDPATGQMTTKFLLDIATTAFQPLIGPKDKRVIMLSNMKRNVALEPMTAALFTGNYKEQVTWSDAATGRLIAESDFFEPMTFGSLIVPGFGGRVYYLSDEGFVVMQVRPALAEANSK